ncbi:pyridoxamine 5'-phosphate oxidase family protein [Miniphocaeibacter halophilus]|uniref:Pyridoxamine 5'-phosphate oxidase family protein n=1 Tax=Miniphocaeibacter halophilus TaxID=2931922 RepID=A0AC61MUA5_9FIRM|nr:pyridoxamine 5'-phosphate oxidase family protein [Miniphocaeibacter halophilus]QQK06983.1 pyridoxamine 5'-phosphate oxidase family protein [Miniphocaeibacter halophilus]
MRKAEREVFGIENFYRIALSGDVIVLAFNNGEYPYVLPVNYGCELRDDNLYFYFHGALEGNKYDFIYDNAKLTFEIDCNHELIVKYDKGYCTMAYDSIIGKGVLRELKDYDEIYKALNILVKHHHKDDDFKFNPAAISRTRVFEIKATNITGKSKK